MFLQLIIRSVLNIVLLFILLFIEISLNFFCGAFGIVDKALDSRSKESGVQFPLLVICRSVGQTCNVILPLPTQQWWVSGEWELWMSSSSWLHTSSSENCVCVQYSRSQKRRDCLSGVCPTPARDGWMDERCFRPPFCTIKAELGRGQPGLMRWSWDETLPQCSINRSTLHTAAHRATSELAVAPPPPPPPPPAKDGNWCRIWYRYHTLNYVPVAFSKDLTALRTCVI